MKYAEYVAVSEDANLVRLPERLDPVVAASLPAPGVTALEIVQNLGGLVSKTVLIVGAAGGVGSFATQLAAQAGAHVDASARADAAGRMRAYGAAESFDHIAVSIPGAVRRAHPDGVDDVIDVASDRDGFATVASLVRPGGTGL
jgi:NADPH:quinone reductase-like Zn-dependent oxidoreductase